MTKNKMNILHKMTRYAQKLELLLDHKNLSEINVEQYWISLFFEQGLV